MQYDQEGNFFHTAATGVVGGRSKATWHFYSRIGKASDRSGEAGQTMQAQYRCTRCKQPKTLDEMMRRVEFRGDETLFVTMRVCQACHAQPRKRTPEQTLRDRISYQNRLARDAGAIGDLTLEQWQSILERSQGKCCYCSKYVGIMFLVIEHLVPIARGGSTTIGNVAAACKRCNWDKGNKTDDEYRALLG
jgi:5-methylcytosine-specific restriction endonuclease McrA